MRKYKVEDLYVALISDYHYSMYHNYYVIKPYYTIVKYTGFDCCHVILTDENIFIRYKHDCSKFLSFEKVIIKLYPLSLSLEDKNVNKINNDDVYFIQEQLNNGKTKSLNLSKKDLNKKQKYFKYKKKIAISNGFLLEIKKVMDKINPNMSEELQEEYKTKLSNIGNEYINSVIENYNSIKLNPSIELEILKKYLEKLGVLEEEIVKSNYRSNLERELEQVKRYTNNN